MSAIDKLLDREEERALGDLERSLVGIGETLVGASDLRNKVRARPWLAVAGAAVAGFFASPLLIKTARRVGSSNATARAMAALPPNLRRHLVITSLRSVLRSS
jgi:hypothetical protein